MSFTKFRHDDQAASEVVSYILSLSILLVVVTTIGVAGTQHMDQITDQQASNQLSGVGQQIAYDYQFVDQSVRADSNPSSSISQRLDLPERVVGQQYSITIDEAAGGGGGELYTRYNIILSSNQGADATVRVDTRTPLKETTVRGGEINIVRPQPTQQNVDSGHCEPTEGTVEDFTTFEDARGESFDPDTCKITIEEVR